MKKLFKGKIGFLKYGKLWNTESHGDMVDLNNWETKLIRIGNPNPDYICLMRACSCCKIYIK